MENKYKRLAGNTIWSIAGNSLSKLLSFLLLPFYTRWLGTEGFGVSDLINTYSSLLLGALSLCIADGIFVFTKNEDQNAKEKYYSSLLNFSIVLFMVWGILFYILNLFFIKHNTSNAFADNIWLVYGMIFTGFLQSYTQQFVISLNKIRIYAFSGIILCATTFIFSFFMIPRLGVEGYVLSYILANIITCLYSFLISKSFQYFKVFTIDFSVVRKLLRYTIPLIPNAVMWWLVQALNRPVMENYLDYSQIGIFAVSNKFPAVITMLFALFSTSWNISVFEEFDKPGFKAFYSNIFRSIFLVISVASVLIICFSKNIIQIFAAAEFEEAWKIMSILIVGALFSCMSGFFGTIFSIKKQSKYFFFSSLLGAIISIILNFVLIPRLGIYGAAISTASSFFVMAISRYIYSKSMIDCRFLVLIMGYALIFVLLSILSIKFNSSLLHLLEGIIAIVAILVFNIKCLKQWLPYLKRS